MHPGDLDRRGLCDGARARLRSAAGEIEVDLQADAGLLPGVVCLPHGYRHHGRGSGQHPACALPGARYNDLSDPALLDAPSGNAALNGIPVELLPLP